MIADIITTFFVLWIIIGAVAGLSLYAGDTMPHDNRRKNNIAVLILGPFWWITRGLVIIFKHFKRWIESEN